MLDFVLSFSELIKTASALYKDTTDTEKQKLTHLVFSELEIFDGKVDYKATEEFEPLLNRTSVVLGGARGIRTLDLLHGKQML